MKDEIVEEFLFQNQFHQALKELKKPRFNQTQRTIYNALIFESMQNLDDAISEIRTLDSVKNLSTEEKLAKIYAETTILYRKRSLSKIQTIFEHHNDWLENLNADKITRSEFEWLSMIYLRKGSTHFSLGNLTDAESDWLKSLEIQNKYNFISKKSSLLGNLGILKRYQGNLNEALDYLDQSLNAAEKLQDKRQLSYVYHNISSIYYDLRNDETALIYLLKSYYLKVEQDNSIDLANTLYGIIDLYLITGKTGMAKQFLDELESINENQSNNLIQTIWLVAKSSYLMNTNKLSDWAEVPKILDEILKNEVVDYQFTIQAMIFKLKYLVESLKIDDGKDKMIQIEHLLNNIEKVSVNQNIYTLQINNLILKAHFHLIKNNYDEGMKLLSEAASLTRERGLIDLLEKIKGLKEKFEVKIVKWKDIVTSQNNYFKKLEELNINEYLEDLKREFL